MKMLPARRQPTGGDFRSGPQSQSGGASVARSVSETRTEGLKYRGDVGGNHPSLQRRQETTHRSNSARQANIRGNPAPAHATHVDVALSSRDPKLKSLPPIPRPSPRSSVSSSQQSATPLSKIHTDPGNLRLKRGIAVDRKALQPYRKNLERISEAEGEEQKRGENLGQASQRRLESRSSNQSSQTLVGPGISPGHPRTPPTVNQLPSSTAASHQRSVSESNYSSSSYNSQNPFNDPSSPVRSEKSQGHRTVQPQDRRYIPAPYGDASIHLQYSLRIHRTRDSYASDRTCTTAGGSSDTEVETEAESESSGTYASTATKWRGGYDIHIHNYARGHPAPETVHSKRYGRQWTSY
jgi:hypothetical protein